MSSSPQAQIVILFARYSVHPSIESRAISSIETHKRRLKISYLPTVEEYIFKGQSIQEMRLEELENLQDPSGWGDGERHQRWHQVTAECSGALWNAEVGARWANLAMNRNAKWIISRRLCLVLPFLKQDLYGKMWGVSSH